MSSDSPYQQWEYSFPGGSKPSAFCGMMSPHLCAAAGLLHDLEQHPAPRLYLLNNLLALCILLWVTDVYFPFDI